MIELAGGRPDPKVQGRDLGRLIAGDSTPRPAFVDGVLGGLPHEFAHYASSVIDEVEGRVWSYVAKVEPVEATDGYTFEVRETGELYDLDADPGQLVDLADAHPSIVETLRRRLLSWYEQNEVRARPIRRTAGPPQPLLSEEETERLKALGYAE